MKYLLDTHAFIWWDSEPSKLSVQVLAICQDPTNILFLSIASIWEMQIKSQLGKLTLLVPLATVIERQFANRIGALPISIPHIHGLEGLPSHHRDPFDRMLVAQARVDEMPILSCDPKIAQYPVSVIW